MWDVHVCLSISSTHRSMQELMVRFEPQDRLNMPTHQLLQFPELAELYG